MDVFNSSGEGPLSEARWQKGKLFLQIITLGIVMCFLFAFHYCMIIKVVLSTRDGVSGSCGPLFVKKLLRTRVFPVYPYVGSMIEKFA